MRHLRSFATALAVFTAAVGPAGAQPQPAEETAPAAAAPAAKTWYPAPVERRQPPLYEGGAFTRLGYVPLAGAAEPWRVCAVVPPTAFQYFQPLVGGLSAEAERQGVALQLTTLENWDIEVQAEALGACLDADADALISTALGLDQLSDVMSRARARGTPVVEVALAAGSARVAAKIVTDWVDVGRAVGSFLADRHPPGGTAAQVAYFYGPPGSEIARDFDRGFRATIADGAIELVVSRELVLEDEPIRRAIRELMASDVTFDAVVGGARTIQIVVEELAAAYPPGAIELVSSTVGEAILQGIEAGRIFAAVNDGMASQGRIALDLAIRAIEGHPHLIDLRPTLQVVDRSNVGDFDRENLLPPMP